MIHWLISLTVISVLLFRPLDASVDLLFSEEEDPALYHHVHVISGHLNLCFHDMQLTGAIPYSLTRTYTSAGALERNKDDTDLILKKVCKEWLIQGGWNYLPHTNLFLQPSSGPGECFLFLTEKNGSVMTYSHKEEKKKYSLYTPDTPDEQTLHYLNARLNPQNNRLHFNHKEGNVTLYLADGSVRHYDPAPVKHRVPGRPRLFQLKKEISPDKHETHYSYDKHNHLQSIRNTSPGGKRVFSSVNIELVKLGDESKPFHFVARASSGQVLHYRSTTHKERHYLSSVEGNCRASESVSYSTAREGIGARLETFSRANQHQFTVSYYEPDSKKQAHNWNKHPNRKKFFTDKVKTIHAPLGPKGEIIPLAHFTYEEKYTDVRDSDRILTRYHHDGFQLSRIDYFDASDTLHSSLRFLFANGRLKAKVLLDHTGTPLFSKTFHYDAKGNLSQEIFFGNLTGHQEAPLKLLADGSLEGADSYTKSYAYNGSHLLIEEKEQDGLTLRYTYKPDTTLVTSKLAYDGSQLILRTFFTYNGDNLLVSQIEDDGTSPNPEDLSQVTERHIKRYTLDPNSGLPITLTQSYLDNGNERLLKRTQYTYSPQGRITAEALYDSEGQHAYTLYTRYDDAGNILSQTTPSDYINSYLYTPHNELLSAKEQGKLLKKYTYNIAGLPLTKTEVDANDIPRTDHFTYDAKGRLLRHTTANNTTTIQTYDAFGHCIQTTFPPVKDENGNTYHPTLQFSYDTMGNLTATTTPQGHTTHTTYNALRKPLSISYPDGTLLEHRYDVRGLVTQTTYADHTTIRYTYDTQQRKTSEKIFSPEGDLLSEELWQYSALHLLSHTDPQSSITHYTYASSGQLSAEQTNDRSTLYTYDSMGRLCKTMKEGRAQARLFDTSSRITSEWIEDRQGRQESLTQYTYNFDGFKTKATRFNATDLFTYDPRGRLASHTDPLGHTTQFIEHEVLNDLDQLVDQTITIDPLLNRTLKTYDALGHLLCLEKQNAQELTVAREEYRYDHGGNRSERLVTLFDGTTPLRTHRTSWEYDSRGRLIREQEHPHKTKTTTYTNRGLVASKALPSGITFQYAYDPLGRLIEQESSDGTIHYRYFYSLAPEPIQIDDLIQNHSLFRQYNPFSQLIYEANPLGLVTQWSYDSQGRCTEIQLPNHSSVLYQYDDLHLTCVQRYSARQTFLYEHRYLAFDPNGHCTQEAPIHNLPLIHTTYDPLERPLTRQGNTITYGPSGLVTRTDHPFLGPKTFAYDALNQLIQEPHRAHRFDSLGNPLNATLNAYNQIISLNNTKLSYDPDGNPIKRTNSGNTTQYTYDALARLTSIDNNTYAYDAFGRIISKNRIPYFYDQDQEMGTPYELKITGLETIAIELDNVAYAPVLDLSHNIIALLNADNTPFETYPTDSFGKSILSYPSRNPWRFSSKRTEEHLVFFGQRFYDPALGRFLTPDPTPESPNLYLYVLNNPLNRLDLFGLSSEFIYAPPPVTIDVPLFAIYPVPLSRAYIPCHGLINRLQHDFVVSYDNWHRLKISPEEHRRRSVNILDHFHELLPQTGPLVGLITSENGMFTSLDAATDMHRALSKNIPEGPLHITKYNKNDKLSHCSRVFKELRNKETPAVSSTRQFMATLLDTVHTVNPQLVWLHLTHSEGGLITHNATEGMTPEQQSCLKEHLFVLTAGAAHPVSKRNTLDAINLYSTKDYVTKHFALPFLQDPNYNIKFLPCETPVRDRMCGFIDHGILDATYVNGISNQLKDVRKKHPIYDPKTR